MKIDVLTLFPSMFESPFSESIIHRGIIKGLVNVNIHNIRDFTCDTHRTADDSPFGGGPGMVLKPEPIYKAVKKVLKKNKAKIVLMSPQGKILDQKIVKSLAKHKHLLFICGHYEGLDERVMKLVDFEISIGDYVLTGGELPAMVVIDAIARLLPGIVKEKNSVENDSFFNNLLDYPTYTRPRVFHKMRVPNILLSGNHNNIRLWRLKESLRNTYLKRPDLLKNISLNSEQIKLLNQVKKEVKNEQQHN